MDSEQIITINRSHPTCFFCLVSAGMTGSLLTSLASQFLMARQAISFCFRYLQAASA